MTIDAGLPSGSAVACGAIRVMGSHVRVRRVKCVNWGNRSNSIRGYVIALIIADPDANSPVLLAHDAGIEDCVAVTPSANNNVADAQVSIFHIGGRFGSTPHFRCLCLARTSSGY